MTRAFVRLLAFSSLGALAAAAGNNSSLARVEVEAAQRMQAESLAAEKAAFDAVVQSRETLLEDVQSGARVEQMNMMISKKLPAVKDAMGKDLLAKLNATRTKLQDGKEEMEKELAAMEAKDEKKDESDGNDDDGEKDKKAEKEEKKAEKKEKKRMKKEKKKLEKEWKKKIDSLKDEEDDYNKQLDHLSEYSVFLAMIKKEKGNALAEVQGRLDAVQGAADALKAASADIDNALKEASGSGASMDAMDAESDVILLKAERESDLSKKLLEQVFSELTAQQEVKEQHREMEAKIQELKNKDASFAAGSVQDEAEKRAALLSEANHTVAKLDELSHKLEDAEDTLDAKRQKAEQKIDKLQVLKRLIQSANASSIAHHLDARLTSEIADSEVSLNKELEAAKANLSAFKGSPDDFQKLVDRANAAKNKLAEISSSSHLNMARARAASEYSGEEFGGRLESVEADARAAMKDFADAADDKTAVEEEAGIRASIRQSRAASSMKVVEEMRRRLDAEVKAAHDAVAEVVAAVKAAVAPEASGDKAPSRLRIVAASIDRPLPVLVACAIAAAAGLAMAVIGFATQSARRSLRQPLLLN